MTASPGPDIMAYIDTHQAQHLERVRTFVRQPSISADGTGIAAMADLVAATIREVGGSAEVVPTAGHPAVLGRLEAGAPKTLLFYGMYDVQPVEGEDWTVPPFAGEVVELPAHGPSVVARGVFNSKGPMAGFFNALAAYRVLGAPPPVNVLFLIEGEEELGSRNLPEVVAAHREVLRADAAYFASFSQDARGIPALYLGVKGIIFMELVCRGGAWGGPQTRMIHGSNAVWIGSPTWRLLQALASMMGRDEQILIDGFYDEVADLNPDEEHLLQRLAEVFDERTFLAQNDVQRFRLEGHGETLLRNYLTLPTLNIDGLASGWVGPGSKTVLPHEARARVDIRLVPHMDIERTLQRLRRHLDAQGYADIEIHRWEAYPWAQTPWRSPAVQALVAAIRDQGIEPYAWPRIAGSAPMYLFSDVLKMPFVMGGLGHGGRAHSPNEYATVTGLRLFERSVAGFLQRFGEM
ncbi:MAG: M20/M25/M40 family metallo-hydrolase [Armatimonadetes bacterium]|nr:M20/M25/M40 family metallo-hydrolase [Armatimonadota bacterium]